MATSSVSTRLPVVPVVMSFKPLSLQSATAQAKQIHVLLKKDFDTPHAILAARKLYREGVDAIALEVKGTSSEKNFFTPVMLEVEKLISNPQLQHHVPLHNVLSRVYRLFTDLTWYKCWTTKTSVFRETRKQTLENCRNLLLALPKGAIKARFEYKCVLQGAKLLVDSKGTWGKYFKVMGKVAGSGFELKIGEVLEELGTLKDHIKDDWTASWFVDVWRIRWFSARLRTAQDFKETLGKEIPSLEKQDPKLSLCVAMLLKDLLRNADLPPEVKQLALEGLFQLLHLKHGIVSNLMNHIPLDVTKKAATKVDLFEKTRRLVIQYLGTLIRKESYKSYQENSLTALMRLNIDTRYKEEKKQIRELISKNTSRVSEVTSRRDEVEEDVGNLRFAAQSKGEADATKLKKAEAELDALNKDIEGLTASIDYSQNALTHVETTEKEEKHLIEQILQQAKGSA